MGAGGGEGADGSKFRAINIVDLRYLFIVKINFESLRIFFPRS